MQFFPRTRQFVPPPAARHTFLSPTQKSMQKKSPLLKIGLKGPLRTKKFKLRALSTELVKQ